jgi:hypothetical protein
VIDTGRGAVVDTATDVGFPDADGVIWNFDCLTRTDVGEIDAALADPGLVLIQDVE